MKLACILVMKYYNKYKPRLLNYVFKMNKMNKISSSYTLNLTDLIIVYTGGHLIGIGLYSEKSEDIKRGLTMGISVGCYSAGVYLIFGRFFPLLCK